METPFDTARRYVERSQDLKRALEIDAADAIELSDLAQGEHNANFTFLHPSTGKRYVLRVNYASQLGLDDQIGYEYGALRELERSGRTPKAFFVDGSRQIIDHGVLVMEFFEGHRLRCDDFADMMAAAPVLADIHSVAPSAGARLLQPADPLHAQFEECLGLYGVYERFDGRERRVQSAVGECIERTRRALERMQGAGRGDHASAPFSSDADASGFAPNGHILNTEAVPSHFLIPDDGGRAHMVDWEKAILGEPAQDVAYFLSPTTSIWDSDHVYSPQERTAFVERYWQCVDGSFCREGFDERFGAYVMTNCLRGITWSCKAVVDYLDPDLPLKNDKTRRKLEVYLSDDFLGFCLDTCF